MSTSNRAREARLQSRFEELTSSDAQLVAAQHNPAITATPLA
jgi:predicted ATPase